MPADCRWNCCWRRERCGECGTMDGHPVEMFGLIAIPARDANCPLEGADSTLGVSRNDLRYLVAQKCSNRRSYARLAGGSPKAGETDLTPSERLFVQVGPRVRIRLPPAGSQLRTRPHGFVWDLEAVAQARWDFMACFSSGSTVLSRGQSERAQTGRMRRFSGSREHDRSAQADQRGHSLGSTRRAADAPQRAVRCTRDDSWCPHSRSCYSARAIVRLSRAAILRCWSALE